MSKKLVIILVALFLVLIGGMGGGLFMMWSKLSALEKTVQPEESTADGEVADAEGQAGEQDCIGPLYSLDTFIVNLRDADNTCNRFLRTTMDLELRGEAGDLTPTVDKRLPQIRDSILMTLPSKTVENLQSTKGKLELRTDLIAQLNGLLNDELITNIYFKEFVIQ
ncbi:MAG: flagellar basal body-associated FliL family protein [Thermodesulfobacteriota bacterium]|nr:flagellar basal body-associated FliL family protein [Thermodesulfobacteriota bacterium]